MTLNQYLDEWTRDAVMHPDKLDEDAQHVPVLHAKWWRFYAEERLRFKKSELEYKKLYHLKYLWFRNEMLDHDRIALGWEPRQTNKVAVGREMTRHMDADPDIQKNAVARIAAEEACKFIESVLASLNKRSYDIKNAIDFLKFKMGM